PMAPEQATSLVTTGAYRFTRNPMYLGLAIWLGALTFYFSNPLTIIAIAAFIWTMTQWQIKPEEKAMLEKFGDVYVDYCKRVRRWI
ncbi:MAG: methyltransferase family protein, partial [Hyphococcus sp.]